MKMKPRMYLHRKTTPALRATTVKILVGRVRCALPPSLEIAEIWRVHRNPTWAPESITPSPLVGLSGVGFLSFRQGSRNPGSGRVVRSRFYFPVTGFRHSLPERQVVPVYPITLKTYPRKPLWGRVGERGLNGYDQFPGNRYSIIMSTPRVTLFSVGTTCRSGRECRNPVTGR